MTGLLRVDGTVVLDRPGSVRLVGAEVVRAVAEPGGAQVHLAGVEVTRAGVARRAGAGLVVLGAVAVAPEVSVRDHLLAVPGVRAAAADAALRQAPLLGGRGGDPAGWLSGGERQVLGWLRVDLLRPAVAVLDGAGRGLDAHVLAWAGERVRAWVGAGTAVAIHPGRPEEAAWVEQTDGPARA